MKKPPIELEFYAEARRNSQRMIARGLMSLGVLTPPVDPGANAVANKASPERRQEQKKAVLKAKARLGKRNTSIK